MERQIYICPQETLVVRSLIDRYQKEVVRNQRSAESTVYILRTLNHHLGKFFIQDLAAITLSKYIDLRLENIVSNLVKAGTRHPKQCPKHSDKEMGN